MDREKLEKVAASLVTDGVVPTAETVAEALTDEELLRIARQRGLPIREAAADQDVSPVGMTTSDNETYWRRRIEAERVLASADKMCVAIRLGIEASDARAALAIEQLRQAGIINRPSRIGSVIRRIFPTERL